MNKENDSEIAAKLQQREAELTMINSVQQALLVKKEMGEIYELIGEKLRELFDAQVTGIYTFDLDTEQEHFQYLFEDGERLFPESRPLTPIRVWLIENKKMLLVNEDADETIFKITGEGKDTVPGTRLPKSLVFVPLVVDDNVRGCVSLQNLDHEHAFSDSDVRLLNTLANSMSVALENARLFNETEQRNAELAVINSVQQGLVAEMDMQGIYDLVGDRIRDLFDAQVASIATFDHEKGTECFQYYYEDGARFYPEARPYDKIRKWLIQNKRLLLVNEDADNAIYRITGEGKNTVPGTRLPKSVLFVPMVIGDDVRGYVSLQNLDHEHAFPDSDVRLLSTLANSMSVALENARLFNETEQRNAELAVINSVQRGLVAEMNMQGIYDLVGEKIRDLFDAQVVGICTFNHENNTEHFQHLFEDDQLHKIAPRPIDNLRKRLIDTGDLILINENADDAWRELTGEEPTVAEGTKATKSALYVPMTAGDTVFGYITLQNLDREHAFNDSDVSLLGTLVNSMSVALENARLFNETEQRNAELAVINSVQDGLVREMDMATIYKLVGEKICAVLNTQTMVIRTFDHVNKIETWHYAVERDEVIDVAPQPFIFATEILIKTKKHLLINTDFEAFAVEHGDTPTTKGLAPKSAIFVPMIVGDTVVGSVSLQNVEEENAFSESDLQLITTLTNSMSVAIENARLFNETTRLLAETEQRAAELQTVNNISRAMVSQLELDALISLVGDQMRETFNADIVYLATYDRKSNMLHFPYFYGDNSKSRPFGNGITEKIILNQKPLLINHDLDKAYDEIKAEKKGEMVESYLGVPILAGEKSIGVISVQSKEQTNRFSENDLRLLTTIAANVGVAMQNAESYDKLRSALSELQAAQEQLVQQEKLASLGQLTAGIAHEIKNPLNFVNNFSEVSIEMIEEIREDLALVETQLTASSQSDSKNIAAIYETLTDIEANLTKILEHGTRADGIVKSMLLHSRGGSGKMEPSDLNAVVKEYVNLAYHGMRAGKKALSVEINLDLDDSIRDIPLITEDFSRVILNLCNNAFDAMRDVTQSPKLHVRTKSVNKHISIEIGDNGPGISDDIKDKILQPFFTTKKGTQGTGLGLSITNDIIKAHGGELSVNSTSGSGSTFIITLKA